MTTLVLVFKKIEGDDKTKYDNFIQACSYGYKLVCVDDKFSKPFKSFFRKNAVYIFISSMIEGSKYCSDVMKKTF